MIVRFFKNTYPVQIVLVFMTLVALWIPAFFNPVSPNLQYSHYQPIYNLLVKYSLLNNTILNSVVAIILIFIQALLINRIVNSHNLISKTTFLPALIYVLLMSFHPAGLTIHPTLFANLFLILILQNLFSANDEPGNLQSVISIGVYLGAASLFYFPVLLIFPFILFLVPSVSAKPLKEIFIYIAGLFLPYYFYAFTLFMQNRFRFTANEYTKIFHDFLNFSFNLSTKEYIMLGLLVIIFLIALARTLASLFEIVIAMRRKIVFLIVISIGIFFGLSLAADPFKEGLMLFFPVSVIIIGKFIAEIRNSKLADVILLTLVTMILLLKFM